MEDRKVFLIPAVGYYSTSRIAQNGVMLWILWFSLSPEYFIYLRSRVNESNNSHFYLDPFARTWLVMLVVAQKAFLVQLRTDFLEAWLLLVEGDIRFLVELVGWVVQHIWWMVLGVLVETSVQLLVYFHYTDPIMSDGYSQLCFLSLGAQVDKSNLKVLNPFYTTEVVCW